MDELRPVFRLRNEAQRLTQDRWEYAFEGPVTESRNVVRLSRNGTLQVSYADGAESRPAYAGSDLFKLADDASRRLYFWQHLNSSLRDHAFLRLTHAPNAMHTVRGKAETIERALVAISLFESVEYVKCTFGTSHGFKTIVVAEGLEPEIKRDLDAILDYARPYGSNVERIESPYLKNPDIAAFWSIQTLQMKYVGEGSAREVLASRQSFYRACEELFR